MGIEQVSGDLTCAGSVALEHDRLVGAVAGDHECAGELEQGGAGLIKSHG